MQVQCFSTMALLAQRDERIERRKEKTTRGSERDKKVVGEDSAASDRHACYYCQDDHPTVRGMELKVSGAAIVQGD